MKIAVYSKDADTREYISERTREKGAYSADCAVYTRPEQLLKQYRRGTCLFDAVYMELETEGDIQAAKEVRHCDRQADIIFIIVDVNLILNSLEAAPTACIKKPMREGELEKTLSTVRNHTMARRSGLLLKSGSEIIRIPINDVVYMESMRHNVAVYTRGGRYEIKGKLEDILKNIDAQSFARTHRSYAVNMASIRRCTADGAYISDEKYIPVSRTYRTDFQRAYERYSEAVGFRAC